MWPWDLMGRISASDKGVYSHVELWLSYVPRNRRERPQQFSAPVLDSRQLLTLIPTNNHTRDVVMLGGSTDEFVEILHNV
jgi:acetyl-CoA carboxylase carboxyltransferase component